MTIDKNTLVSDIVADNYKSARVFKSHKIDFCCNGNRPLEMVCKGNLTVDTLIDEILETQAQKSEAPDYQAWDIGFLSDYIYHNHHTYVEKAIPELKQYLHKISRVHGENHPELIEVYRLFCESADDLTLHMKKEELILFPYFKKLAQAEKEGGKVSATQFKSVESPISMMHQEHDNEGSRFRKIAELTNDYTPPSDACMTYRVAFSLLKDFEDDLHKHIHLENNILFKRAIKLEHNL